jgi:hypothetical protein
MTIADLLTQSMAEHKQALAHRQKKAFASAIPHLERAYRLRLDAHREDPEHSDPAWAEDQRNTPKGIDTHAVMIAFYEQHLGPQQ